MRPEQVEKLGKLAFSAHVNGRKTLPGKPTYVLGFDSEFYYPDPEGGPVPICFQLADENSQHIYRIDTPKLTLQRLTQAAWNMAKVAAPQAQAIVLLSWWSQAELSIMDLDGLDPNDPDLGFKVIPQGNGLWGWRWKFKPGRGKPVEVLLLDLSAYFASSDPNSPRGLSLRQAAKEAGLEKLEYDVSNLTPEALEDPDFVTYAVNDARLCCQIGNMLRQDHNETWSMQPFGTRSVGHLTSALFQYLYVGTEPIHQPHPDVRELALLAYRGSGFAGGVWARGVFPGQWAEFDAASMYPTSAREIGMMPTRQAWKEWQDGDQYAETGIYRAEFKWPAKVKHRSLMGSVQRETGEGYQYPQFGVDTFSGYELKTAEKLGCQVRIVSGWYYNPNGPHMTDCLSKYLSHLVAHRDIRAGEGKKLLTRHYKALANVLIGKLGQHIQHKALRMELTEEGTEYSRTEEARKQLSTIFAPEWWVLITGYSKAVFAEVCAEFDALHGNVDAVLIADPGVDEFTRRGITFKRKASGDLLKLVDRNQWAFFQAGEITRMATYGGKQVPAVAAAFEQWDGSKVINVEYETVQLVKMMEAARGNAPLLQRKTKRNIFTLVSADTPLENFEQGVDIRPVARPARRKPGDAPKRGQKSAEMRARLEASRRRAEQDKKGRGGMKALLHGPLHTQEFTVFKSKALIRRELVEAAQKIGMKLKPETQNQMVEALKLCMEYRNETEGVRVELR